MAYNGSNKARLAYADLSSYHELCSQMSFIACYRLPFISNYKLLNIKTMELNWDNAKLWQEQVNEKKTTMVEKINSTLLHALHSNGQSTCFFTYHTIHQLQNRINMVTTMWWLGEALLM